MALELNGAASPVGVLTPKQEEECDALFEEAVAAYKRKNPTELEEIFESAPDSIRHHLAIMLNAAIRVMDAAASDPDSPGHVVELVNEHDT